MIRIFYDYYILLFIFDDRIYVFSIENLYKIIINKLNVKN